MQYIVVTLAVQREGRAWVSECVKLGTASCGRTRQEALENIKDATTVYLNGLEDLGECEEILRSKGVVLHTMSPTPEPVIANPIDPPKQAAIMAAVFPVACESPA
jgi:predicted RNase H-like HicB family nuclease